MTPKTNSNVQLLTTLVDINDGEASEYRISNDVPTEQPVFAHTMNSNLSEIKNIWHYTQINHLELKKIDRFAEFSRQIPYFEAEITAYMWINGKGISPNFLGLITEAGKVIGLVLEYIDGARMAESGDPMACQCILAKLHSLGNNTAKRSSEREELEWEHERLEYSLRDLSRRGRVGSSRMSEQLSS
ncbi:hypothetical protein B0O99DRAFT_655611 [Bisporella sp. PMI_857]|nr:hypothetical protein B0O99DRAFT_655611 [Bisporella sp. PMI_857]